MINTVVTCDQCGDQIFYFAALGKNNTISLAKRNGWSMGKKYLCPKCRKRKVSAESIQIIVPSALPKVCAGSSEIKTHMSAAYKEGKHE